MSIHLTPEDKLRFIHSICSLMPFKKYYTHGIIIRFKELSPEELQILLRQKQIDPGINWELFASIDLIKLIDNTTYCYDPLNKLQFDASHQFITPLPQLRAHILNVIKELPIMTTIELMFMEFKNLLANIKQNMTQLSFFESDNVFNFLLTAITKYDLRLSEFDLDCPKSRTYLGLLLNSIYKNINAYTPAMAVVPNQVSISQNDALDLIGQYNRLVQK